MFGWGKKKQPERPESAATGPHQVVAASVSTDGSEPNGHAGYEVVAVMETDPGCIREINEDSVKYFRPTDPAELSRKGMIAIVADGMGGHSAGEVASRIATEVIKNVFYETDDTATESLRTAFNAANHEIHQASQSDKALEGMGTTCTALVLQNGSAHCAYVGDTRLYLIRGGEIYVMTEDHSAVMEMVHMGIITLEQARHHEDKNVIIRALGSQPEVEVSVWSEPFPVREGDKFLLCSDGLSDLVEDEEIKKVLLAGDSHASSKNLIALARERGGYDNVTVGILSIEKSTHSELKATRETREVEIPA
ncbi:MAG TPA: Stp1/IreP family PP2C-type Ser/Thr phosphatase [Pyrinomonadaceae bacterium]|nr:Stp1/IreP family PP2C-type Ser/Thr phosphatase [Pyrinomonadaceae bacterium]